MGRAVPVNNLHLTLAFLDEQPEETLQALHEELEDLRLPAFDLSLKGVDVFGGVRSRALAVLAEQNPLLLELQKAVVSRLYRVGITAVSRRCKLRPVLAFIG